MNARRAAALLEVLGVYVIGQYLVTLFTSTLHLQLENPLARLTPQMTGADLLFASRDLFWLLLLQYAGWFVLIVPINWWHRGSGRKSYGLTRSGKSWKMLLAVGAAAALAAWPEIAVQLLDRRYDLGPAVPWRQALFEMSWRRWQFWLFAAVLSYAFVAFMEELFYRGYCQRRLAEDWGDGPAICGTACLFLFSHGQYLFLNAYNISQLASLLILAVAMGVVFAWTRSLVPSILAHAIINVPMTPFWQVLVLAGCLLGTAFLWRRGLVAVKQVFASSSVLWCLVLAAVATAYVILSQREARLVYIAAIMLGLAIAFEAMQGPDRGAPPVPQPPQ
jgi:membrane protease YdiL (CAAX protease family)